MTVTPPITTEPAALPHIGVNTLNGPAGAWYGTIGLHVLIELGQDYYLRNIFAPVISVSKPSDTSC